MQTQDAIRARRNVRAFSDQPISGDDLTLILDAARRSPSSQNTQPWDLIVVTDRDQLRALAAQWHGAKHVETSALTVAVIAAPAQSERHERSIRFDLGQLTMSMMIAAADLGIGSGHAGIGDQERVRALLGHPSDRVCAYLVAFGFPADGPLRPTTRLNRRPLGQVVHRGTW